MMLIERGHEGTFLGVIKSLYTFVKTHQIVHIKLLNFVVCQLSLIKLILKYLHYNVVVRVNGMLSMQPQVQCLSRTGVLK